MSVLAQAGFGKSTYIDDGLLDGTLSGAILSPRDEEASNLKSTVKSLSDKPGVEFIAIDPQFYAFAVADGRLRCLDKYPYNPGFLSRRNFSDTKSIHEMSIEALKFQQKLSVTHLIAPAIQLVDLRDSYSQVFITMAQESIKYIKDRKADSRPLLLSLVLSESSLLSPEAVDEFLDVITAWDYDGVYVCVQTNNSTYPATMTPAALTNLLYLIYVLTELNSYTVVIGYADFNSLLFRAAGASYVATGWYNSLKQFSLARFLPAKQGGSRARPRYPSRPLLASILLEPELAEIIDSDLQQFALSGLQFDDNLLRNPVSSNWPASIAYRAHVAALAALDESIPLAQSVQSRFGSALLAIERAWSSVQLLSGQGVTFETRFGFLKVWQEAVEQVLERT